MIQFVESVKIIEQQYRTGEEPVLVMCSDKKNYVCKYMRTSSAAYKLSCELFDSDWTTGVWKNYMECLKENL